MKLAQTLSPQNSKQILYMNKQDNELIIVYENDELIWLTYDDILQSAIYKEAPYRSVLPHSYIMMLPLLHDSEPKTILELGAGALSAQRYLKAAYPAIEMLSVEYNEKIINVCEQYFPAFEQLNVLHADAFAYVDQLIDTDEKFDWLMVDLFYGVESPMHDAPKAFIEKLASLVNPDGWLIVNVLTKEQDQLAKLNQIFKALGLGKVYLYAVPEMQNHIFLIKFNDDFAFPVQIEQHNLA